MKKLLYLSAWDFEDGPSTGITKKIRAQIKAFEGFGYEVSVSHIAKDRFVFEGEEGTVDIGAVGKLRKLTGFKLFYHYLKKEFRKGEGSYPYVYSRYQLCDLYYLKILKLLKKHGARIIVEIPTYPYDEERPAGILWWGLYSMDKVLRCFLHNYADRILTYSDEENIFSLPTIRTSNGVDLDSICEVSPKADPNGIINIIAVAGLAKWHGYDRFLRGLGEYYRANPKPDRIIHFHIAGDGPVRGQYEAIVKEYGIEEYVTFYGMLYGKKLDELYDKCQIGIENLGFHRCSVNKVSTIKSKEYAAKGIPFITSCDVDLFKDEDFVLSFDPDESDIDINRVIAFNDRLYKGTDRQKTADRIREIAAKRASVHVTLKPVDDFFGGNIEA